MCGEQGSLHECMYLRPHSILYAVDDFQIAARRPAQRNLAQKRGKLADPDGVRTRGFVLCVDDGLNLSKCPSMVSLVMWNALKIAFF